MRHPRAREALHQPQQPCETSALRPARVGCREGLTLSWASFEPRVPSWFSSIAEADRRRIPTAPRWSTSVHSPAIRLTTLGGQYRRHPYRLETMSALALHDYAYDKVTGWSNVIPVVPVKGDATEACKFMRKAMALEVRRIASPANPAAWPSWSING